MELSNLYMTIAEVISAFAFVGVLLCHIDDGDCIEDDDYEFMEEYEDDI